MLKKIGSLILRYSGIPFIIREISQRRKVTIILYHDIHPELFESHIKTLNKLYNIISLQQYLEFRINESGNKLSAKSLIVTFDDGHRGNYHLLYMLKRFKIPITIFLCSDIVNTRRHYWFKDVLKDYSKVSYLKKIPDDERLAKLKEIGFIEYKEYEYRQALNKVEIEEMKEYVDFQSHARFHPILPNCPDYRSFIEIQESKYKLEGDYGISVNSISYPNGDYSDREILFAIKSGYVCGITTDCGYNNRTTDLFRLKRICMDDSSDINELIVRVSGLWCKVRNLLVK